MVFKQLNLAIHWNHQVDKQHLKDHYCLKRHHFLKLDQTKIKFQTWLVILKQVHSRCGSINCCFDYHFVIEGLHSQIFKFIVLLNLDQTGWISFVNFCFKFIHFFVFLSNWSLDSNLFKKLAMVVVVTIISHCFYQLFQLLLDEINFIDLVWEASKTSFIFKFALE